MDRRLHCKTTSLVTWLVNQFETGYSAHDSASDLVTSLVTRLVACVTCLVTTTLFMFTSPHRSTSQVTRLVVLQCKGASKEIWVIGGVTSAHVDWSVIEQIVSRFSLSCSRLLNMADSAACVAW